MGAVAFGAALFEIDIPDIKMPNNINMYSYITVSTAYTMTIVTPYTLNEQRVNLGFLVTKVPPPTCLPCLAATYNIAFATTSEICLGNVWNFNIVTLTALAP